MGSSLACLLHRVCDSDGDSELVGGGGALWLCFHEHTCLESENGREEGKGGRRGRKE